MRRSWEGVVLVRLIAGDRRILTANDRSPPSILVTARPVVDTYTPAPVARYGPPEFVTGIPDHTGGRHR